MARRSLIRPQGVKNINGSSCLDVSSQTWPRASGVFLTCGASRLGPRERELGRVCDDYFP